MKKLNVVLLLIILLLITTCIKQTTFIHKQQKEYAQSTERLLFYISELKKEKIVRDEFNTDIKNETDPRKILVHYSIIYDIDPALAVAISRAETGNWSSPLFINNNNFGGMRGSNGWHYFESIHEGAEKFCELLAKYKDRGQVTIEEIVITYCPNEQEEWIKLVTTLYDEEVQ